MNRPYTCRRCQIFINQDQALEEYLSNYIQRLPDEQRVDQDTYERRLMACEKCKDHQNAICRYCGCFVTVRAVKRKLDCPKPFHNEWK